MQQRKVIGLVGGMSWESTARYYEQINRLVGERSGGLHSARCVCVSIDCQQIADWQAEERWDACAELLTDAVHGLERAGADMALLCANTAHKTFAQVQANVHLPMLHIADAAARSLAQRGIQRAGILGTRYTLQDRFLTERLQRHRVECILPDVLQTDALHALIYRELCRGVCTKQSAEVLRRMIRDLADRGAQGVLLACTELGLLVSDDAAIPIIDTVDAHVQAAVDLAFSSEEIVL